MHWKEIKNSTFKNQPFFSKTTLFINTLLIFISFFYEALDCHVKTNRNLYEIKYLKKKSYMIYKNKRQI